MLRVLLLAVLFVAAQAAHRHHPKFRKAEEVDSGRVTCSKQHENERHALIEESRCGAPKDVFVTLESDGAHLHVSPSAVWVKRCVGLCHYDSYDSKCVATRNHTRIIPVRIFNVQTSKEYCTTYAVEEHLSCGCCAAGEACEAPRIYDPRKCACRCPNRQDRRNCRNQPNQIMKWNPSKCMCEERIRVRKAKNS